MIEVTRLNGEQFLINSDLIEMVDAHPDTVITLLNEHKFVVKETTKQILEKVIDYKRKAGMQVNIKKGEV